MVCIGVGVAVGVRIVGRVIVLGWGRVRRYPVEILSTISHLIIRVIKCRRVVVDLVSPMVISPILMLMGIVLPRIFGRRWLMVFIIVVAHVNNANFRVT